MAVRHEYLEHLGLDADAVARSGAALALAELNMRFLAPLRSRDACTGTLRVTKVTAARVAMEQQLIRDVPGTEDGQVRLAVQVKEMKGSFVNCHW
jgi:acyl-CoA thioesterase FadM